MNGNTPTLEDLIALNREIAALVNAGIPIESGLRGVSGMKRTRFEKLADRLADRLATGQSLPSAFAEEGPAVSPVYTAVIEAGLISGRLPQAFESMARSGQIILETRRRVILAAIYPTICIVAAYALICLVFTCFSQQMISILQLTPNRWIVGYLRWIDQYRGYFVFGFPAVVVGVISLITVLRHGPAKGLWDTVSSFRWIIGRSLNWSQFTELLALQVDQNCPLPNAIVLAADSTDDLQWQKEARAVCAELTNGASLTKALCAAQSLPPLVRWMISSSEKQGTLSVTLRQLSEIYRRRTLNRAAIVKTWLPVAMTILFTSAIGLTYGFVFFIPLRSFLEGLGRE